MGLERDCKNWLLLELVGKTISYSGYRNFGNQRNFVILKNKSLSRVMVMMSYLICGLILDLWSLSRIIIVFPHERDSIYFRSNSTQFGTIAWEFWCQTEYVSSLRSTNDRWSCDGETCIGWSVKVYKLIGDTIEIFRKRCQASRIWNTKSADEIRETGTAPSTVVDLDCGIKEGEGDCCGTCQHSGNSPCKVTGWSRWSEDTSEWGGNEGKNSAGRVGWSVACSGWDGREDRTIQGEN